MALRELATVADIESAWRKLDNDEQGGAAHLLRMAHALVRVEVPTLDRRIEHEELDPELVRDVVVSVVLRVLRNPDNARGRSRTAGPFTEYVQLDADSVGLTLHELERRVLAPPLRRASGLGSIRLGAGLGFPPDSDRPASPVRRSRGVTP